MTISEITQAEKNLLAASLARESERIQALVEEAANERDMRAVRRNLELYEACGKMISYVSGLRPTGS